MPSETYFSGESSPLVDDQNENVDDLDEYIVKNAPFSIKGLFGLSPSLLVFHKGKQVGFYQNSGYTINGITAKMKINPNTISNTKNICSLKGFLSNVNGIALKMQVKFPEVKNILNAPIVSEIYPRLAYSVLGARDSIVSIEGNLIAQKVLVWKTSELESGINERYYLSKDSLSDQRALLMSLLRVLSNRAY